MNDAEDALGRTGRQQSLACDPRASAWVSANAGSGKTYVLTRRVIRLLLEGADPSRILCLTFTKAAAAEMSRRVFGLLAQWTECDDDELAAEILALEGARPSPATLQRARKLFALALETPGGLKIQTIHAFCEALLQRFPLEANVPGHFRVLDESDQSELIEEARQSVFAAAPDHADAAVRSAFAGLLEGCTDHQIAKILGEMSAERHALQSWLRSAGGVAGAVAELSEIYGLDGAVDDHVLDSETLVSPHLPMLYLQRCVQVLERSGMDTDLDTCAHIRRFLQISDPAQKAQCWVELFRTQKGEWRKPHRMVTKRPRTELGDFLERVAAEIVRLEQLVDRRRTLAAVALTGHFLTIGEAVLAAYERAKTRRGLMDFEDLIVRSLELLANADAALWVHYKLDQGIDHILVDEAQDTSPAQWSIVRALADEFYAGSGARPGPRTLFAVGDEKQSIYSFQGAEPRYFIDMRKHFAKRAADADEVFNAIALRLSFRSTPDVLGAVDAVFADAEAADGLSADGDPIVHDAVRLGEPGEVRVWPLMRDMAAPEPDDWSKPIDVESPQSAKVRLAARIAEEIAGWLETGARLPGTGQAITAGDILILVRKRDAFVGALVRELKSRRIAVAGSDRLVLTDHIAVQDLVALGRVMVLREDDLSLAAVLKSPLFGFSEDDLFDIAHDRGGASLWDRLAARAAEGHGPAEAAREKLVRWMGVADFERPYEFFSRVLERDGGLKAFKARFGSEVDDVLDQFLQLALDTETGAAPSLDRFLHDLAASRLEIKRELDAARDEVRIMTVHGAKGLEAPIVYLVDPGSAPRHVSHDPAIMKLPRPRGGEALSVVRTAAGMPALVGRLLEDDRRAGEQEYRRLLYVALTRARDRLVVCGYEGSRGAHPKCWHRLVWTALAGGAAQVAFAPDEVMLHWQKTPLRREPAAEAAAPGVAQPAPLPDWIARPAAPLRPVSRLTPSHLVEGGDADEPGPRIAPRDLLADALAGDSMTLRRGRLVHRLLELLPDVAPQDRRGRALAAAKRALDGAAAGEAAALVDAVLALIGDERFGAVFSPGARSEISLSGWLTRADGSRHLVSGQIDRLLVEDERVTIIDYKTNRNPPSEAAGIPRPYVAQLALYRALLTQIYPQKSIEAALLWTTIPALMPVPAETLEVALAGLRRAS